MTQVFRSLVIKSVQSVPVSVLKFFQVYLSLLKQERFLLKTVNVTGVKCKKKTKIKTTKTFYNCKQSSIFT